MYSGDHTAKADDVTLPPISVIVPFTGSDQCILDCLYSLRDMDYPPDKLEIIAIEDSNTHTMAEIVRRHFPDIVLQSTDCRGCDGAKQKGINSASGDIIALTDADCVVTPRWARVIAKALSSGEADAVTGLVRHPKTFLRELVGVLDFQDFQGRSYRMTNNAPGCNFASHREVFEKIGYQQASSMKYGSDRLMTWRIHTSGLQIVYDPCMEVYHQPAVSPADLMERRIRYGRKALMLRKINPSMPGASITRLGLLAAPAYLSYKTMKDSYRLMEMAAHKLVNPWHLPLLFPSLLLFRLVDTLGMTIHERE